ncbi:hypothetical protein CEXT_186541 [Caerostris extrusa]|uniref:Uncharacterized protein n=1 Tax=Caerostris extrusa TaxID=172846 RepID=A0AAV4VGK9_CAEEX|nr:hypothetical protein CEXT_186541 [Caerostris extrusa]
MSSLVSLLCIVALAFCAVSAAPPFLPYGLGGVSSYFFSGAPVARVVAPYAAAPAVPAAVLPDYYAYSAASALSYPGYGYGYGYGYPYVGAYAGYPYVKK